MTGLEKWAATQPRNADGKVDARLLIPESQRRGYCVCPKPFRQVIDFSAEGNGLAEPLRCVHCDQPETRESYDFWYRETVP